MALTSHWAKSARLPKFPQLDRDLKVDVVVIGGGITGITAAYLLKKAGKTVALLERDQFGRGDTSHTTAHLTYVTDVRLNELVSSFGKEHARSAWDAGRAAIDQIARLVEAEQLDCGFARVPGYLHAPLKEASKGEIDRLREDTDHALDLGFDAKFLDPVPVVNRPGIRFMDQAKFHPLRYLAGLLARIPGERSDAFEHSEATEFLTDPFGVKVNGHLVRCGYLVLATHVPLMGNTGFLPATLLQTKLASYSSYVLGANLPPGRLAEGLFADTSDPYYYLRIDRTGQHDYAIFGGEDHKTGQETDARECLERLEDVLKGLLPDAQIDARWTGQVVETPDGLPYIGETAERQFVATGFAGNGMTFGTLAGMMAVDAALGRKGPWADLFDVNRKKLSAAWQYLKENVDFPYHFVKDKLTPAAGSALSDLKAGEGKILKVDGQRVAAYRDRSGKVTQLSPVCTHLGCDVRWNQADATWDCPCHGSRFKATGEVIAGPAETPLEEVTQTASAK